MHRRSRAFRLLLVLAAFVVVAILARDVWLGWIGRALVRDDGPAKADAAVVLAGDYYGHRVEKAAQLVKAGYAPVALVSGPRGMYGVYECDLAIAFIVREGYPKEWFVAVPHGALSTREEAPILLEALRKRGARSFLLVTSSYHTARAARIFRSAMRAMPNPPAMRVVAAPDEFFRADSWWRSREGQKIVFFEWSKALANAIGL